MSQLMNSTLYTMKQRGYVIWLKAFNLLGTEFQ